MLFTGLLIVSIGLISVGFFDDDDCVGVGRLERIVVSFQPPVPGNVELHLNATSGVFVNETVVVETGKETETLYFNGTDISQTTISVNVTGLLYPSLTLDFNVFGTIFTSPDTYYMIQGAPKYFNVSVLPEIDPLNPPFISTTASNAIVTPNAFVLDSDGVTEVEVIPIYYGISRVTYSSENYCPTSDLFSVAVAPICSEGYIPNIIGDTCVICPGNFVNDNVYFADSTCTEHGECGYSKCFTNKAVCFCNYPYVGFACQWNSIDDASLFDSSELNNNPFMLHVDNFPHTTGPTAFYAPGDLIAEGLQPGFAIVAGYDPSTPFFGAVNPASNPPTGTAYSGISWYWENTCDDNTIITNDFTAPVNMTIPIEPEVFTSEFLTQAQIWRHDDNTGNWVRSSSICSRIGYNSTYLTVDLLSYTVSGSFCAPGQYAIFIVPVTPVPANTGNTIVRNPSFDELSTTASGTGKTGWQPKPPVRPPVNPQNFDPSPGKVLHLTSVDDAVTIAAGSITVASIALLSASLLLLF